MLAMWSEILRNLWFVINQANDVEVNQFIEITANETAKNQKLFGLYYGNVAMVVCTQCMHIRMANAMLIDE